MRAEQKAGMGHSTVPRLPRERRSLGARQSPWRLPGTRVGDHQGEKEGVGEAVTEELAFLKGTLKIPKK